MTEKDDSGSFRQQQRQSHNKLWPQVWLYSPAGMFHHCYSFSVLIQTFPNDKLLAFRQRSQEEETHPKFLAVTLRSSPTVFLN